MKFGLIIQGPLLSIGRDGRHAHIQKTTLKGEGAFVNYDCRDNITRIIKDFGGLFHSIVISTWQSELKQDDHWDGAQVVGAKDPGEVIRNKYVYRGVNKHRQFIGIRFGLEKMEGTDIDYVLRVRTDQYLDIKELLRYFSDLIKNNLESNKDIIGVPLTRPADYMTHDLYFIAKFETLKNLCDAVMAYDAFEFNTCVHRDMLLKHAYVNYRDIINVSTESYFPYWPPLGASIETKKIFTFMYERVFIPLGRKVYETVEARGTLQSREHIEEQYKKELGKKNFLNLPNMFSIDLKRYYSFNQKITGRPISLKNIARSFIGYRSWKTFNFMRKVAQKTGLLNASKFVYKKILFRNP